MASGISVSSVFSAITFKVNGQSILDAASRKLLQLQEKIKQREARIHLIREENGITDEVLAQLLIARNREHRQSYAIAASNTRVRAKTAQGGQSSEEDVIVISAGTLANLEAEQENIDAERAFCSKLGYLIRNLSAEEKHTLTFYDLEALGL